MHREHEHPVLPAPPGLSVGIALCGLVSLLAPVTTLAGDPSPPTEEVTIEALRATSPVFGIPLGTSREEAERKLAKRAHDATGEELLVWNALTWGGAPAEQTYLAFAPERGLVGWRAEFRVEGEGAVKEIMRLTDAFCGPLGESERVHPMPPTPRPGDGPPPDVTEIRCKLVAEGVESTLRERVTTPAKGPRLASVRLAVWRSPDDRGATGSAPAPAGPVEAWLAAHGAAPGAERPVVDGVAAASAHRWGTSPETARAWVGFEAPDRASAEALDRLVGALCAPHGGADSFTPSPLGTPDPGEDWDPVITTTGGCEGVADGVFVKVAFERTETRDSDRSVVSLVVHPGERPADSLPLWQSSTKDRSLYGAFYELTGFPELDGGVLYVPVRYGAGCRPHRWLLIPDPRPGDDPREPRLGLRNDAGDDACDFPVDDTVVLEVPGAAAGGCVDAVHLGVHFIPGRFDAPYSSLSPDGTLRVRRSDGRRCP